MANTLHDHAQRYHANGLCTIPLRPKGKEPATEEWKCYQKRRPDGSERWDWFGEHPDRNIACVCGRVSGGSDRLCLAVIDFDEPEVYEGLAAGYPDMARTPVVKTSKGYHVYFRTREPTRCFSFEGGDVKGEGGYTVLPPSLHPDGTRYRLVSGEFESIAVVDRVADLGIEPKRSIGQTQSSNGDRWITDALAGVNEGERNATAARLAGYWQSKGVPSDVVLGQLTAWNELNRPPLPLSELKAIVSSVARYPPGRLARTQSPADGAGESPKAQICRILTARGVKAASRKMRVSSVVSGHLLQRGHFFHTEDGICLWFDDTEHALHDLESKHFRALFNEVFGVNPATGDYDYCIEDLITEASIHSPEVTVRRYVYYDDTHLSLYFSCGPNEMVKVTADWLEMAPNGTDGVYFVREAVAQPFTLTEPDEALLQEILYDRTCFADGQDADLSPEQQGTVFQIWLESLLFPELLPTRVILLLLGIAGSGKTTLGRRILLLLFGEGQNVSSLTKASEGDFWTLVTNKHVVVFDNADTNVYWLNDALATVATGGVHEKRRLYTTNELGRYPLRAFVALTARTPHLRREDVADRLLILQTQRLTTFIPESELIGEILEKRDVLLSTLLHRARRFLAHIQANGYQSYPGPARMADFATFAGNWADCWERQAEVEELLTKLEKRKLTFALEEEPLYLAMSEWVKRNKRQKLTGTASTMVATLKALAEKEGIEWSITSSQGFGKRAN